MNNDKLLRKIIIIIAISNIPVIITAPWFLEQSLGWIFGSMASAGRLIWLYYDLKKTVYLAENKAKIAASKGYYLRFLALIIYSVLVVLFLKPDIIIFGLGLLSAQIAIYLNTIIERYKK